MLWRRDFVLEPLSVLELLSLCSLVLQHSAHPLDVRAAQFLAGASPLGRMELTRLRAAGANNYLGLSNHPRLVAAAHAALDEHGFGLSSVRFICGTQARTSILYHLALDAFATPAQASLQAVPHCLLTRRWGEMSAAGRAPQAGDAAG